VIFVTGTKRSGTSMWMQALVAAGFPAIGSAFPANWQGKLKRHNPRGFYESMFRNGVNFETNPHPETGVFLFPEQVERHVVKTFPGGLVRTDYSFIHKVVATIRDWRSYDQSVRALVADDRPDLLAPKLPPWLEWWLENYTLIRDVAIRKHAVVMTSYDAVLRDPERAVGPVVDWLGGGDRTAAISAIDPALHRSTAQAQEAPAPEIVAVFDSLYDAIDRTSTVSPELAERMNATQVRIVTEYREVLEAAD